MPNHHARIAEETHDMDDAEFIRLARKRTRCARLNTATGAYLEQALRRLGQPVASVSPPPIPEWKCTKAPF